MSEKWLSERAPGFKHLPSQDCSAIFSFVFLWSLFEAQVMKNYAHARSIREKVDEWTAAGTLGADLYDDEVAYFRNRYFRDGALTYHFSDLKLRSEDHRGLVHAVIEGAKNDPRDRVLALMMVVWRLRNNLFHGEKWAYELGGQLDNFTHANRVLMRLLEQHGQVAQCGRKPENRQS